jgi:hypothetical protein
MGGVKTGLDVLNPGAVQETYPFESLWPWAATKHDTCGDVRTNNAILVGPKVAHGVMVSSLDHKEAVGLLLIDAVYS